MEQPNNKIALDNLVQKLRNPIKIIKETDFFIDDQSIEFEDITKKSERDSKFKYITKSSRKTLIYYDKKSEKYNLGVDIFTAIEKLRTLQDNNAIEGNIVQNTLIQYILNDQYIRANINSIVDEKTKLPLVHFILKNEQYDFLWAILEKIQSYIETGNYITSYEERKNEISLLPPLNLEKKNDTCGKTPLDLINEKIEFLNKKLNKTSNAQEELTKKINDQLDYLQQLQCKMKEYIETYKNFSKETETNVIEEKGELYKKTMADNTTNPETGEIDKKSHKIINIENHLPVNNNSREQSLHELKKLLGKLSINYTNLYLKNQKSENKGKEIINQHLESLKTNIKKIESQIKKIEDELKNTNTTQSQSRINYTADEIKLLKKLFNTPAPKLSFSQEVSESSMEKATTTSQK